MKDAKEEGYRGAGCAFQRGKEMTIQTTKLESHVRPSAMGKLNLCIHWRSDGLAGGSPYVQRGIQIDEWVRKFITGDGIGSVNKNQVADVAAAEWVSREAKALLTKIECQKALQLVDMFVVPPEVIMEGTCDLWGFNRKDDVLEVWDVKSGIERDYSLQLMSYALMLMDETSEAEARIRVAYCDSRILAEWIVSRSECEAHVFGIIERIRIGVEPPEENEYCGQCARQSTCPVWVRPAEQALMIVGADHQLAAALDPVLAPQDRLAMIKNDPVMLGRFIDCWRKAEKLVEKAGLEDYAKELLLSGKEVPGWRASECEGRAFYTHEQIEKILQEWGESAAQFLSVNREKYEGECRNSDNDYLEPEGRSKSFVKLLKRK